MFNNTRTEISGTFVRICSPEQADFALKRHSSERPAARYNRQGQDALYLAISEDSARVALRKYAKDITTPLVLVNYQVDHCQVVDLRHEDLNDTRQLASQNWQDAIAKGEEPTSWQVSDLLRAENEIGLIDPSRKDPSTWHVTLFRWNEEGAPSIRRIGEPTPIQLT